MQTPAHQLAHQIFQAAQPAIRIHSLGGPRWKRDVAKGARIGPWLPAAYDIVNHKVWGTREPCLYLVAGDDAVIRYVGISRNGLKNRWRECPAFDALTMVALPKKQLFHSQCWKHIEREHALAPQTRYEIRCIHARHLLDVLENLGPPLSGFTALRGDGESVVASVERWLCNHKSDRLVLWNVAMTR